MATKTTKKETKAAAPKKPINIEDYEGSLPEVASNFLYACKKCDAERYHKVLTHVDEIRAKVECEVCSSKKTYRLKKIPKKTTRRKSAATAIDTEKIWNDLKEKLGTANAMPYAMANEFLSNSIIDHPKFGLGFVTTSFPNKIEVLFEDGTKKLVHNR